MLIKNELFLLIGLISLDLALLVYAISNLSISYYEAQIYFNDSSFIHFVTQISTKIFGVNDFALRMPFVVVHIANIFLLYQVSKPILTQKFDRFIAVLIYMFLPGVLASALLVNNAGFIVLISLLGVSFVQNDMKKSLVIILIASIFISKSFLIFYIALMFYGFYSKNKFNLICGILFIVLGLIFFDFNLSGKPKGYAIDTFGVFAAVFSPLIFVYFVYTIYRIWVKEEKDFLWFLSNCAFCISLILSIRQKLDLELFLPYLVIFIPHMVRLFLSSYRIRLPQFRKKYIFFACLLLLSLGINSAASIFYNIFYLFLDNPKKHFVYKFDIAKDLANEIKNLGINAVSSDPKMALRLKFYGINSPSKYYFADDCLKNTEIKNLQITKFSKKIAEFKICKEK